MNRVNAILHRLFKMKGLEVLQQMDYEQKRKRYRSVPINAITKSKFSDATANDLTKAILAYLKLRGHMAWRQSSEGRYRPGQSFTDVLGHVRQMKGQYLPGTNKGHADVCSIIAGLFCAIEVKMKDSQSQAQKDYQQQVEGSGGRYYIARDFESFHEWFLKLTQQQ